MRFWSSLNSTSLKNVNEDSRLSKMAPIGFKRQLKDIGRFYKGHRAARNRGAGGLIQFREIAAPATWSIRNL